mgnify:CR=1 FL=1
MFIDLDKSIYTYDEIVSASRELEKQYGDILKCVTIGKSHDNRDIVLLKLGLGQNHLVCSAGVHGRETINPVVLVKVVEYYAMLYRSHESSFKKSKSQEISMLYRCKMKYGQILLCRCVYELLKTYTILFVPLLNPDGYMIALEGFDIINDTYLREYCKKVDLPHKEWKFNGRAVDINRNFPSKLWVKKNDLDEVASENETNALMDVFNKYSPLGYLDFHSRGESIYYYRSTMSVDYNNRQLEIANKLVDMIDYNLMEPEEEIDIGDSGGNTVHYFSEYFNKPTFTIETVEEIAVFPLNPDYRQKAFNDAILIILEFGSLIIV